MLVIKLSCVWDSGDFWSFVSFFHWHRLSLCFSYFSEYRYKIIYLFQASVIEGFHLHSYLVQLFHIYFTANTTA